VLGPVVPVRLEWAQEQLAPGLVVLEWALGLGRPELVLVRALRERPVRALEPERQVLELEPGLVRQLELARCRRHRAGRRRF
jgi:hypothetical protein